MTSYQYLSVYDELLYRAIDPIVRESEFAKSFVPILLGWQEKNFRRKIAFNSRAALLHRGLEFLSSHPKNRITTFRRMRLERGVLCEMVSAFMLATEEGAMASRMSPTLRKPDEPDDQFQARCRLLVEQTNLTLGCPNFIRLRREAAHWLYAALSFRERILQKYYRLCITTAQRDYVNYFDHSVPLDDVINSYIMGATRAIDKCDFRQGVLTSHITTYFLTARENVGKSRGSTSVPLNEAIPIDDLELLGVSGQEASLVKQEEINTLLETASLVDPTGAGRTFLRLQDHEIQT